ncbi:YbaB/EbfC family DNA-binding protein [Nonomuraea sp. CA-218870]|uniref:YbaB/EbfC family DNA-binding protein n=1 Tax=Nonomuraea sp. CA-218870 TaxID=3239998 RepID=UPI003D8D24B1
MQGFGDFANIDVEKLIKGMDQQLAGLERFQRSVGDCVGKAEDEDGFVSVVYDTSGVRDLTLHPKAMRMSSGELADLIKTVLAEAAADFQRNFAELAGEVFGEEDNPMKMGDPQALSAQLKEVEAVHDRAFTDVMAELDRIRRRLDL